jgi:hypothetical protein
MMLLLFAEMMHLHQHLVIIIQLLQEAVGVEEDFLRHQVEVAEAVLVVVAEVVHLALVHVK